VEPLPQVMPCPRCGAALPPAFLMASGADAPHGAALPLAPHDLTVGRGPDCDVAVGGDQASSVSRHHARLLWSGKDFELEDRGSTYGTFVNDIRLHPDQRVALVTGDRVRLGGSQFVYVVPGAALPPAAPAFHDYVELVSGLATLDPATVVARGLNLMRAVSGVPRAFLVGAGIEPALDPLLTRLDDPGLAVSRSLIAEALASGRKAARFVGPGGGDPTESMVHLDLRRIWVHPVPGIEGRPIAAFYLDSPEQGEAFLPEVEHNLDAVVELIGVVLRNATLHARVLAFNADLERKVTERTRQLEQSRAQLVAQDRLVTLGRLVAAIAHEMNNPVGAIASFAGTLRGLAAPLLETRAELAAAVPEPDALARAQGLLDLALDASRRSPLDTRVRREREEALAVRLAAAAVPGADLVARRLARIGLAPAEVEPMLDVLRAHGGPVSALAERLFTFGRSLETIGQCSADLARIVDGLKTYAHLDRSTDEMADLHRGIQAALAVLAPRIPHGIEVTTRFDTVEAFVHRPGELTQVWTNLVDNAVRAMGESGTLAIETRDQGDRVRITVTDSGPGIPPELHEHIFDLHVTTRGPGAGLGLGLPICRTIVERNHRGTLTFESRPGRTSFIVVLPKRGPAQEP
jgi:signal transduction histidine kinase